MTQKTLSGRSKYISIIISIAILVLTFAPWLKIPAVDALMNLFSDNEFISEYLLRDLMKGSFSLWKIPGIFEQSVDSSLTILGIESNYAINLLGAGIFSFVVINIIYIIVSLFSDKAGTSFCTFTMVCCIFFCLCYVLLVWGIQWESSSLDICDMFSLTSVPFIEILLLVAMRYFCIPTEQVVIVGQAIPAEGTPAQGEQPIQVEEKEQFHFCPACGTENKSEAKFCKSCGESMEKKPFVCPNCSTTLEENTAFCINCGTRTEKNLDEDM